VEREARSRFEITYKRGKNLRSWDSKTEKRAPACVYIKGKKGKVREKGGGTGQRINKVYPKERKKKNER